MRMLLAVLFTAVTLFVDHGFVASIIPVLPHRKTKSFTWPSKEVTVELLSLHTNCVLFLSPCNCNWHRALGSNSFNVPLNKCFKSLHGE